MSHKSTHVHTTETDDDAYSTENAECRGMLDLVRSALKEGGGASDDEIEAYTGEATSRYFRYLLHATSCWVQLHRAGASLRNALRAG